MSYFSVSISIKTSHVKRSVLDFKFVRKTMKPSLKAFLPDLVRLKYKDKFLDGRAWNSAWKFQFCHNPLQGTEVGIEQLSPRK